MTIVNQYSNGNLNFGGAQAAPAILNLDGGTLATYQINPNATAGTLYQVNFNGGTLMPYNSPRTGSPARWCLRRPTTPPISKPPA